MRFWFAPFAHSGDVYYVDDVRLEKVDGTESDLSAVTAQIVTATSAGLLVGVDEAAFDPQILNAVEAGNTINEESDDEESEALETFLPLVIR